MIVVTIAGPTKSGKSILAQWIKDSLPLGDSVVVKDDSPREYHPRRTIGELRQVFKGTTIKIIVT